MSLFTALWLCDHLCALPCWASSNLDSDVYECNILRTDCSDAKNIENVIVNQISSWNKAFKKLELLSSCETGWREHSGVVTVFTDRRDTVCGCVHVNVCVLVHDSNSEAFHLILQSENSIY